MKTTRFTKRQLSKVRCNKYHSGNHSLTYSVGVYECSGCGHFHTHESVSSALAEGKTGITGAGGVVRV